MRDFSDRHIVAPDLRPYNAYKPKQGEWRQIKERSTRSSSVDRVTSGLKIPENPQIPLPPPYRRYFKIPTSCTRHENFARYWGGRARGLEYTQPFFYTKEDNHCIEEDRRYYKLPYAPSLAPAQPSVRHGTQLLNLPYVTAWCSRYIVDCLTFVISIFFISRLLDYRKLQKWT